MNLRLWGLAGLGAIALTSQWNAIAPLGSQSTDAMAEQLVQALPDELDQEQAEVASAIVQAGQELGVDEQGQAIALATALQESGLRNLGYGDDWYFAEQGWGRSDSRGAFQQRDHWASLEKRLDPKESAKLFYQGVPEKAIPGLMGVSYHDMSLTEAAAAVQRPARQYEGHYADDEPMARKIVEALR